MISSSSAIALAPAHPQTAEDQPAAIDESHPQIESVTDEEISDQRQRRDPKADRNEGRSDPQSGDAVGQHEIDRPERPQLPRREMAEPADEQAECDEQDERREHPDAKGLDAGARALERADRDRPRDPHDINRNPR